MAYITRSGTKVVVGNDGFQSVFENIPNSDVIVSTFDPGKSEEMEMTVYTDTEEMAYKKFPEQRSTKTYSTKFTMVDPISLVPIPRPFSMGKTVYDQIHWDKLDVQMKAYMVSNLMNSKQGSDNYNLYHKIHDLSQKNFASEGYTMALNVTSIGGWYENLGLVQKCLNFMTLTPYVRICLMYTNDECPLRISIHNMWIKDREHCGKLLEGLLSLSPGHRRGYIITAFLKPCCLQKTDMKEPYSWLECKHFSRPNYDFYV